MKTLFKVFALLALTSCASITNDPDVPVSLSFSDGSQGTCQLSNKRELQKLSISQVPQ